MVEKDASGVVQKQVDYTYDVFGRRIGNTVDPDGPGGTAATSTWTVYDGLDTYADFDGTGSLTNRYLYGPAVDFLLARVDAAGDEDWYLTDNLGSVRQIVDTDGTVLDAIDYDSYGNILSETNPAQGDRFKYTAREWDAAVDLYFYRARYYDPAAGRFISEDPIGFGAGDANLARYVGNSPTGMVDPSGLSGKETSISADNRTWLERKWSELKYWWMVDPMKYPGTYGDSYHRRFVHRFVKPAVNGVSDAASNAVSLGKEAVRRATNPVGAAIEDAEAVGTLISDPELIVEEMRQWEQANRNTPMSDLAIRWIFNFGTEAFTGEAIATQLARIQKLRKLHETRQIKAAERARRKAEAAEEAVARARARPASSGSSPVPNPDGKLGGPASLADDAARQAARLARLRKRADEIQSTLDPIARRRRTTAVLETSGDDIIGGGKRDLSPAQRNQRREGEMLAKLPGEDAEITVLHKARQCGLKPKALVASRPFCPKCRKALQEAGATIIDDRTAIWE